MGKTSAAKSLRVRRARTIALVSNAQRDRGEAKRILREAIGRLERRETRGMVILELATANPRDYKIGWAGVGNMYEAVGILEEAKHQLLAPNV